MRAALIFSFWPAHTSRLPASFNVSPDDKKRLKSPLSRFSRRASFRSHIENKTAESAYRPSERASGHCFLGDTAQTRWSAGEWIFRQMQMQISKVYWR